MRKLTSRVRLLQRTRENWPSDYEEILLSVLRDDRAPKEDRITATEIVHDFVVINDDILTALLALARSDDTDSVLRTYAIMALGPALRECLEVGFEGPDDPQLSPRSYVLAQQTLRELFFDDSVDDSIRREVLLTATYAPDAWVPDAVRAAFYGEDGHWQEYAVICMRRLPGFEKEIVETIASGDEELGYEAMRAVEVWSVDAAWPYLEKILTTPDSDLLILSAAMRTAAKLRPAEAVRLLDPYTRGDRHALSVDADCWKEEAEQLLGRPARLKAGPRRPAEHATTRGADDPEKGGGLLH